MGNTTSTPNPSQNWDQQILAESDYFQNPSVLNVHYSLASPFWAGQYWWIYPEGQGGYSGKGTANIA